jgi:hypothetical protein
MTEIGVLKLQSEIDKRMGQIVSAAEKVITDLGDNVTKIKEAQLRNVMAVANTAPHTSIVTSFIRYQMGRRETQAAWKGTALGPRLIKLIDESVRQMAQSAVKESNYGEVDEVQVQMTRLLLGFMNRRFVYEYDQRNRRGGN